MEPHTSDAAADPPPSSSLRQTRTQDPSGPRPSSFPFLAPAQGPDEVGRIGGFRVLRLLGEGGMGMVFEAEDCRLGRRVAVKVMKPEAARQEEGRRRFLREARAAAAVEHDHVVPVLQVGEEAGVPFLVMPLLRGESLESRLRAVPKLPAAEAAAVGREVALGLAAAHAARLIHRDIKPSNLWLEPRPDGGVRARVLDFGLARPAEGDERLTRPDAVLGTAGYMAPEQARAEPADARADLFALGCVLYRMVTGQAPFRGKTLSAVLLQVQTHHPPPPRDLDPSMPAPLSDLVMRLLSKDPAGRPASAREVADVLAALEHSLPATTTERPTAPTAPAAADTTTHPVAATTRTTVPPARHRWLLPALGAGVLLLLLGAMLLPPVRAWLFPGAGPGGTAPTSQSVPAVFKGFLDVVIYDPDNPRRQNVHLNDPDVLPLKPGDRFAVEAQLDHPGYCYILWIDADGTVDPVYPWRPGHWEDRPAEDQSVTHLRRPEASDHFYPIKESAAGMETLVLLVRDTPLPPDVDLKAELGPVRPQTLQTLSSTVWFENGEVVKGEPGRSAAGWDEAKVDDPVRATQEQIRSRLVPGPGKLFQYTRAVSFPDRGK